MIVLHNARIYTLDARRPTASAIAIDSGRILALGEEQEILAEFGGRKRALDLAGRAVIPGLTDAHFHLQHYALGLKKIDCQTESRAECLRRVAERARSAPPGSWILGHGWNQNDWPEGFGSAADLDAIAPHHPVYLTAKSLHAAWANSAALRLAGLSAQSPDPPGGRIQRDERGNPSGILLESAATLVASAIPEPSTEQIAQAIREAQPHLWRVGLTGVHDFDQKACFTALQLLRDSGELRLRVVKSIPLEALPVAIEAGLRSGFGDDFLRIGAVKAFADGALGPRTAAMLEPYEGEPDNRGMLLLDEEALFEHGRLSAANGLSLAVHAIGDRANREVLKAFARLRAFEKELKSPAEDQAGEAARPPLRHRIEHVQIIHPQDAPRLAELGLIASMQPVHVLSDYPAANRYWGERAEFSYAWRMLLEHGASLAFGSDAPVESPNPFWGLHAAVTRRRADGSPGPQGWYPRQKLTLAEALHGFTAGAAYAAGLEGRLGKLAAGFLADLLVLEADPFACEPEQLREIRPLAAMVAGEWVFLELPLNDSF